VKALREGRDAFGRRINPCVSVYGDGPDGTTCRTCSRLFWSGNARAHSKCELRRYSRCAVTDHSQNFKTCGKYATYDARKEDGL
jgi:hypothetical protein